MNPNQILAQPYYGDKKIRFYQTTNPNAATPLFTLDLSSDIAGSFGPNSVVIHNSKIFVAVANDNGDKGLVLIYNYADFYPTKVANATAVLKFNLPPDGLSAGGMALNPANGDLYIPTFRNAAGSGIYVYSAASNYTALTHFSDFDNDSSVAEVCANLAFDGNGNLWMTTWTADNDPSHHFLIAYKGLNKNTFYKITNAPSKVYAAHDVAGGVINVHLLSAPEGIAFDPSGNLWLANNNDFARTNNLGEGTLVKISAAFISSLLAGPIGTFTAPVTDVDVKHIPSGKLGGLLFDETTLFINDQGQNQGGSFTANGVVWKWDVTTPFNSTNFAPSGIHTTFPGNGSASLLQPFLVMADTATDKGIEPDTTTTRPWQSPDITISSNQPNQLIDVNVVVHNKGMMDSVGTETLKLYWAKASAGLSWPAPWDDTVKDATGATMGQFIGEQTLPVISAGGSHSTSFPWTTPDPSKYTIGDGHFCLLARIESSSAAPFGMTFPELANQIVKNALNNSRIGWVNIHIVNPVTGMLRVGGGVILANHTAKPMTASLALELLGADGKQMDAGRGSLLLTARGAAEEKLAARRELENLGEGVFRVTNVSRPIENIPLGPGEMLNLHAEFVTEQTLEGAALRVTQSEQANGLANVIGGQTFVYGRVAGFHPISSGRKRGCLWSWIAGLVLLLASLLRLKSKRKYR
ncbi:MAG: hypothetical protein QOD12_2123 [Verrucomicrobiota bacterium]|jgi:hypothetical protein